MNNEPQKISLYEHMVRTQMHMDNIMTMSIAVLPKLADVLNQYKSRKAMQKLTEPKPKEEETDYLDNPLEGDRL